MPLEISNLTREFRFKKDGTSVKLEDPNPEFTVQEVMQFYSGQYPELTTASITGPKVEGKTAIYEAGLTVGTKA